MGALFAMIAKAPAAVNDIAGPHRDEIGQEVADLGVPAEHQRHQRVNPDPERRYECATDSETHDLPERRAMVIKKRRYHRIRPKIKPWDGCLPFEVERLDPEKWRKARTTNSNDACWSSSSASGNGSSLPFG